MPAKRTSREKSIPKHVILIIALCLSAVIFMLRFTSQQNLTNEQPTVKVETKQLNKPIVEPPPPVLAAPVPRIQLAPVVQPVNQVQSSEPFQGQLAPVVQPVNHVQAAPVAILPEGDGAEVWEATSIDGGGLPTECREFAALPQADAPSELVGCDDLITSSLKKIEPIGCGCVYCEEIVEWKGQKMILRSRSGKQGCDGRYSVRQFFNQLEVAKNKLFKHPAFPKIYGYCADKGSEFGLGILMEYGNYTRLSDLEAGQAPPIPKANIAFQVLQFLRFLSEHNSARPGSPYLICGLKPRFFGINSEGRVVFLEFDNLLPLSMDEDFKPFPPKVGVLRIRNNRLFAGHACKDTNPCPLHCTQMASAMSEGFCPGGDNATCPGLGPKASLVAFGNMFLKDFMDVSTGPLMANLINSLVSHDEANRPSHSEALVLLCKAIIDYRTRPIVDEFLGPVDRKSKNPDNDFMGCDEIQQLVIERKLGCGCVSCAYQSTWKNTTVVIKKLSNKAGRCDRRHSINLFRNQAAWGVLRVRHPSLLRFYGVCRPIGAGAEEVIRDDGNKSLIVRDRNKVEKNGTTVVVEFVKGEGGDTIYLPKLEREPLIRKLKLVINMAELLSYLSIQKSPSRPGSPYMMCDFKAMQFSVTGPTTVKLVDVDMMVPMDKSKAYHVLPPKIKSQRSWVGGRIFIGYKCKLNTICPMECLFGYKKDMSEYMCKKSTPEETAEGWGRCPGVGPKSTTYMFASNFLRGFLETHEIRPALASLVTQATAYEESERPDMDELIVALKNILADEEASPSDWINYGVPLPSTDFYDQFLSQDDVKNMSIGERINCDCYSCDFYGTHYGRQVLIRRQRKMDGKKCTPEEVNYLTNTVEVANLRIVHPMMIIIFGSVPAPRNTIVMEDYVTGSQPFTWTHPGHTFAFKVITLLRIAYLIKYLSVLSVDRPGSPYLLCDLDMERFIWTRDATVAKFVQVGRMIPISLTLKCQAWPPFVYRNPIYMHGKVWFQRHCEAPGKMVCEHAGCLTPWKEEMSEFECLEDGRCPGAGVPANLFVFGRTIIRNLSSVYPDYTPLKSLVSEMTQYNSTFRPVMDNVIIKLQGMVKSQEG